LSCIYCYEKNKQGKDIEFERARDIIDKEVNMVDGIKNIEIDLFGGEPFLAFDLIKRITEYVKKIDTDKQIMLFATTNGTLIHNEVQEWLIENAEWFTCGLSLDGTKQMHNLNRSNSYDSIDIDFFYKMYPFQDIKMTISQKTLPYFAEGVIELHEKGFLVSCNLAYGIDWSFKQNENVLEEQLKILIEYYLEHPEVEPCSMLNMGLTNIGNNCAPTRYCGAGIYTRAYDIDAEVYPCQYFMPLSVGYEKAKAAQKMEFPNDCIPVDKLDDKCKKCVLNSSCPTCFGANYATSNNIYAKDEAMCKLTQIMMRANAYFNAQLWNQNRLKTECPEDVLSILKAIVKIQNELI